MSAPVTELFFRGILCNWLVCLAIWMSARSKEDIAKLVLIWWCLYAFIASGYEHSVANMTLLSLAWLLPNHPDTISLAGWFHNMIPVTLGNIIGGALFVGMAYWYTSPVRKKHNTPPADYVPDSTTINSFMNTRYPYFHIYSKPCEILNLIQHPTWLFDLPFTNLHRVYRSLIFG